MKAIILAGGFARRLVPFFGAPVPKALLPIGKKLLLSYIVEKVSTIPEIDIILISTNTKFGPAFQKWLDSERFTKPVRLVLEPAMDEKNKLGAVGGIHYAVNSEKVDEDVLIVAGDNLLAFDIGLLVKFYKSVKAPVVAVHDIKDAEKAKLYGVVELDRSGKIKELHEKPQSPPGTLVSTACYAFPKACLRFLREYVESGYHADALGNFIKWLLQKTDVYAYPFSEEWFDIGDVRSLSMAREWMKGQEGGKG